MPARRPRDSKEARVGLSHLGVEEEEEEEEEAAV